MGHCSRIENPMDRKSVAERRKMKKWNNFFFSFPVNFHLGSGAEFERRLRLFGRADVRNRRYGK